jgi:spermidine synthase
MVVLENPQGHIVVDDGPRFLDGSNQSYGAIIVDPPPPPAASGSSLLYSREFYDVVKQHLRPGGILQEWYPAADGDPATVAAVAKALQQSFPDVRAFVSLRRYGIHFLASMQPIPNLSGLVLASRLTAAADFLEWGPEPTVEKPFDVVLSREVTMGQIIGEAPRASPQSGTTRRSTSITFCATGCTTIDERQSQRFG